MPHKAPAAGNRSRPRHPPIKHKRARLANPMHEPLNALDRFAGTAVGRWYYGFLALLLTVMVKGAAAPGGWLLLIFPTLMGCMVGTHGSRVGNTQGHHPVRDSSRRAGTVRDQSLYPSG
jgi:hypothetical protein